MSNLPPPGGPPRQHMGYPSSTAYPPAVSMAGHQYYPVHSQPEPYRPSPIHTNPAQLPSIRSMDPMTGQPAPMAAGPGMTMGMPLMPNYYVNPAAYGMAPDGTAMQRFALPPGDPRLLGPRGPKKVC